eukprot:scaffold138188_cov24-Prasinocladus_malaysianus.AAC.1
MSVICNKGTVQKLHKLAQHYVVPTTQLKFKEAVDYGGWPYFPDESKRSYTWKPAFDSSAAFSASFCGRRAHRALSMAKQRSPHPGLDLVLERLERLFVGAVGQAGQQKRSLVGIPEELQGFPLHMAIQLRRCSHDNFGVPSLGK